VVVNFWATWCEPCVREFPLLARAAAGHRADRLAVVGVLYRDQPDAARAFARRHGGGWPVGVDADGRTAAAWGVVGLPQTFFVRPDGTLASHQLGELTPANLDRQLTGILGG
jgi:cytochrome c biogenesis protein CcmG/thiol:disulfide interchange protein DsbE